MATLCFRQPVGNKKQLEHLEYLATELLKHCRHAGCDLQSLTMDSLYTIPLKVRFPIHRFFL